MIVPVVLAAASTTWAETGRPPQTPPSGGRASDANRFKPRARSSSRAPRRPSTQPRRMNASKYKQLFDEANALAMKVQASGSWSKHADAITQMVESIARQNKWNTDTDQYLKTVFIETSKVPPWDFNGRFKVASDMARQRYGLSDEQIQKYKVNYIQRSFAFFLKHGEQILPVAKDIIETRLAGKPFTPEKVSEWMKAMRPIMMEELEGSNRSLREFAEKTMTPEQRSKIMKDLSIVDRRTKELDKSMATWEKGQWSPKDWGLEKDGVHVAMAGTSGDSGKDASSSAKDSSSGDKKEAGGAAQATTPRGPSQAGGPPRIGESGGRFSTRTTEDTSSLPDETKWVAYVKDFCARYSLNQGQKTTAYAILKDLQEQAQAYRGSRGDEIKRLEEQIRKASSREERSAAQGELRETLGGIEDLFEELKTRLDRIPSESQLRKPE